MQKGVKVSFFLLFLLLAFAILCNLCKKTNQVTENGVRIFTLKVANGTGEFTVLLFVASALSIIFFSLANLTKYFHVAHHLSIYLLNFVEKRAFSSDQAEI